MVFIKDINDKRPGFKGLFTEASIRRGDVILELDDRDITDNPTQTSIQIGDSLHIEDEIGKFINHSCEPNAVVDRTNLVIRAISDINSGDEITFDYTKNESNILFPFVCKCCGKYIK